MTAPLEAPPLGDHLFKNARLLIAEVSVSGPAAADLLPAPLAMAEPATATLFFADYPETAFGSVYKEAGILLHARDAAGPLMHCPWIVVDDDTALILGRELLGFPKKMADVEFREDGDAVTGVVHRKGVEVMRIEADLGEIEAEPAPVFAGRAVNALGSIVGGMKLIEAATEEHIRHARRAEAKVLLHSSDRDPLADLQPSAAVPARYVTLDYGGGGVLPRIVGDVDVDWIRQHFFARAR